MKTELDGNLETLGEKELEVLLEIYRQRYDHVRHLQGMRATYFNFYLITIGFSIAAVAQIYVGFRSLNWVVVVAIFGFLWIMSIFTMMRSERWGGHISHDIRLIRGLNNIFSSEFSTLSRILPVNLTALEALEYNRPLWNQNRSIETPASMFFAALISLLLGLVVPVEWWIRILIGISLITVPILLWRVEVSSLMKRHAKCCLAKPDPVR
jgi:hypothetical protein